MGEKISRLSEDDLSKEVGLNSTSLEWKQEFHDWKMEWTLEKWKGVHRIIKKGNIAKIEIERESSSSDMIEHGAGLGHLLNIFAQAHGFQIETAIGGDKQNGYFLYVKKVLK